MPNPPGRRPRRGSPMPTTSISALAEEMIFLMLLGDGPLSRGVQKAVNRLVKIDPEAAEMMRQSVWMRQRAEQILQDQNKDKTVEQAAIYRYVTKSFEELVDEFGANRSDDVE